MCFGDVFADVLQGCLGGCLLKMSLGDVFEDVFDGVSGNVFAVVLGGKSTGGCLWPVFGDIFGDVFVGAFGNCQWVCRWRHLRGRRWNICLWIMFLNIGTSWACLGRCFSRATLGSLVRMSSSDMLVDTSLGIFTTLGIGL